MHHITRRLSPSLIVAIVALFVALAGTVAAAVIIESPDQIKNGVVTEPKLAADSVTSLKVAPGAIDGSKVQSRTIVPTHLRDPQLRVRVLGGGGVLPGSNGAATRVTTGTYHVAISPGLLTLAVGRGRSSARTARSRQPRATAWR